MARIALVTGAGSGIGREVARALMEDGWTVALAGRREAPLRETAADHDAMVVPTDVTDPDSVSALFTAVRDRLSRLDLLFNNAGVFGRTAPVPDVAIEDWRRVLDTNLTGAFLCAQAAFRLMAEQRPRGGRIVNNGSLSAHVPRPDAIAYTATKHAVTGLTKALALEGRRHDIACGQIDIGNAATEMTHGMPEPTMHARHVADAVRYMASLPLDANVLTMTVMATGMPYVGRG